ncbi:uncharacterized, partial [Tachysurus ichikawai]
TVAYLRQVCGPLRASSDSFSVGCCDDDHKFK